MSNIGRTIYWRNGYTWGYESIIIAEGWNWIVFQYRGETPEFETFDNSKEKQKWIEDKLNEPIM